MKTASDYPHGTIHRYQNQDCRCDDCRQAASDYRRARKGLPPSPVRNRNGEVPHGNYVRYSGGCRCQPCADANGAYRRSKYKTDRPRKTAVRFPVDVLMARCGPEASAVDIAEKLGIARHTVHKWRVGRDGKPPTTLSWIQADTYAIRLGLHPSSVWPDLWWRLDG